MNSNKEKKLLIIEDDLILAKMYKKRFELNQDVKVEIAGNGREGIDKAKEGNFNLIILDILLPEIDGFEVLKLLKSDPQTKEVPVLILTNLVSSQIIIQEALKFGAENYLVKSQISSDEVVKKAMAFLSKGD